MPSNEYHFITHWRVPGTVEEVREILADAVGLARWWPSVYLDVRIVEEGDEQGVGKLVELYTKGWLPYTLRWRFRVTDVREDGFSIDALGDFVGRGIWMLEQDAGWTDVTYDWEIRAEKPLLRSMSFLMKPVFEGNHRWAMAKGEESLKLELARRHAATPEERALVPEPPAPTEVAVPPLAIGAVAAILAVASLRALRSAGKRD